MVKTYTKLLRFYKSNERQTFNELIGPNLSEKHQKDIITALL